MFGVRHCIFAQDMHVFLLTTFFVPEDVGCPFGHLGVFVSTLGTRYQLPNRNCFAIELSFFDVRHGVPSSVNHGFSPMCAGGSTR